MRMTWILTLVLLAAAPRAVDAQRRGAPQSGPVTFVIAVADRSGRPIGDVRVNLTGAVSRNSRTERGRTVFEGLPAGDYRLHFEKAGYLTLERDVTGRGAKPIDVKVMLTPEPLPPIEPVGALPPQILDAKMVVLDMPAFIEKNYVGRGAGKTTPLGCATGGIGTLLQLNEPIAQHAHADADEFIYVIAGEGMARLNGREESLGPAVFLMIPRGMPHTLAVGRKKPLVMMSIRAGEKCGR